MKKSFLITIGIIALIAILLGAWSPWSIHISMDNGYISISNGIAKAADLNNTAGWFVKFEPSGTQYRDGSLLIRLDLIPPDNTEAYKTHHVNVIDESSQDWLSGYPGEVYADGSPVDEDLYNKWIESLPHIWRTNPALCHFITVPREVDSTYLENWISITYTPDFFATLDDVWGGYNRDILVKPVADYISPFMYDKKTYETQKTAAILEDYYINQVNIRLADFVFSDGTATVGTEKVIVPQSIDMGPGAANRALFRNPGLTLLEVTNPANATGTIDTVELWFYSNASGVLVGTFYNSDVNKYTCRSAHEIGDVTSGSKQVFSSGISMSVETDDYPGHYCSSGQIERDSSGYDGYWGYSGNGVVESTELTYSFQPDYCQSIYMTGTEGGGGADISNSPSTLSLGVLEPSSTYWSSGSEPSWPLTDGDAHFTISNVGSISVNITISATNPTGGIGHTLTSGSPGENEIRISAYDEGSANTSDCIFVSTSNQTFITNLASSANISWEMRFETGTFTDGAEKTSTVTLTAVST